MRILEPYNPLGVENLGISIANALLRQPAEAMPPPEPFIAAGIYAIYYLGEFEPYRPIADLNRVERYKLPIYIGKAVPKGARIGGVGLGGSPGRVLYDRLREHAESIELAENLKLDDFRCRFLALEDIWIPLGESLLIETFSPLWNHPLSGFGNHDPGSGRYNQQRSKWDELHVGRAWARKLQPYGKGAYGNANAIAQALLIEIAQHLARTAAPQEVPDAITEVNMAREVSDEPKPAND
ncbi:MAG: hypothetical protein AMXMBFR81_20450 [Chthonomonas sp.]